MEGSVSESVEVANEVSGCLVSETQPDFFGELIFRDPVQRLKRGIGGGMADGDLRHAACLRVLGFAFLSREAFSKAGRAPGPGWT
jgi:hypothetical protein